MKKTLLFLLLAISCLSHAQFRPNTNKAWNRESSDDKKFSFGYYLGTNLMQFKVLPDDGGLENHGRIKLRQDNKMGFSVGMIGKLRINDIVDFKVEPGVHFAQRTLYFTNIVGNSADSIREVKSTYLDIPFLINLHGNRWVNTRPYIQMGIGYAINLQSNEKKDEDNADNVFRMKTHNFNWQAEMGIDIYFKKFKLTPALKGIFFFNNELVADNPDTNPQWAGSLKSLKTQGVFFSLKFE